MTTTETDDRHTAETRVQGAKQTGDVVRVILSSGRYADHVKPDVLPNTDEWVQIVGGWDHSTIISESTLIGLCKHRHPDTEVIPESESLFGVDGE